MTADIAKGLSPFSDFFNYKASAEKYPNGTIHNLGNVGVNFGASTLSGQSLNIQQQSTGFATAIPGGKNTIPISYNSDFYPKYDNALGRIALLKTPTVNVGRQEVITDTETTLIEFTDRISFDESTFEYVFNPAAGVSKDETVIFAGLEIIATKTGNPELLLNDFHNINLNDIDEIAEEFIFNSEFVPLSCLGDLGTQLKFFKQFQGNTPYLGEFTIKAINIKLVINYAFEQIGRSGTPNQAVQIITYPTTLIETDFEQIPPPISNDNNPIQTILELATNQHFTTDTKIFAWEKIIINGNLTAANGVNIEIIAPEVVIENGQIGTGISITNGFFPNNCSPLNTVSTTTVADFCNSSLYKADKAKLFNQEEENPIINTTNVTSFELTSNPVINFAYAKIELPQDDFITLTLFDISGKKLQTIAANELTLKGEKQFIIPTNGLSHGVYFLHLETKNGFNQTLKLVKL